MMFKTKVLMIMLMGSLGIAIISPYVSIMLVVSLLLAIHYRYESAGLNELMIPGRGKITVLWITKTRKIYAKTCTEKAEGYLKVPPFGVIRVTKDSNYWFAGRPCLIGLEGVPHTAKADFVQYAKSMDDEGLKDYNNAKEVHENEKA